MSELKRDQIWAAIEKCFPIEDTIWMPDANISLYELIYWILEGYE